MPSVSILGFSFGFDDFIGLLIGLERRLRFEGEGFEGKRFEGEGFLAAMAARVRFAMDLEGGRVLPRFGTGWRIWRSSDSASESRSDVNSSSDDGSLRDFRFLLTARDE
jgi:hypothetical protein